MTEGRTFVDTELEFRLNSYTDDPSGLVTDDGEFKTSLSDDIKTKYRFSSETEINELRVEVHQDSILTISFLLRFDYFNEDDTKAKEAMIKEMDEGRYEFFFKDDQMISVSGSLTVTKDWKENWHDMIHSVTIMVLASLVAIAIFTFAIWYLLVKRRKTKPEPIVHEFTAENTNVGLQFEEEEEVEDK
ncbi:uncharacterized protein [Antedon mediterranea]|uniref:uncharacterized protein n=1 Tax=Antedon mediterranea TaxID=105859 RepID=UPI003AF8C97E